MNFSDDAIPSVARPPGPPWQSFSSTRSKRPITTFLTHSWVEAAGAVHSLLLTGKWSIRDRFGVEGQAGAPEGERQATLSFTRNRRDGSVILSHENLWIVVRKNGKWGIQLRSY
jgi:hypothetical protein